MPKKKEIISEQSETPVQGTIKEETPQAVVAPVAVESEMKAKVEAVGSRAAFEKTETPPAIIEEVPGKPRVIGGVCEFCGTGVTCIH